MNKRMTWNIHTLRQYCVYRFTKKLAEWISGRSQENSNDNVHVKQLNE